MSIEALVGIIAGITSIIVGGLAILGTLIGELSAKRTLRDSLAGSVGTLVGFVVATGLKLFVCLAVAGLFLWSWLGA